jgi:ubiquinone/menaquinone biosynthesis C-methylase UbiE
VRGFEQIPWAYDLSLALFERLGLGRWRAWLVRGARGRTLDLGSGTGRNLPLVPPSARAIAVDPHLGALARARARAPGVPLVAARAEALPFRDGAFDTVVCGLVLCSVDDPDGSLAEVRRVLRPGGVLRLLEHVRRAGLGGRLQDLVQPAWTVVSGGCRPNRKTEATIDRAGFEVVPGSRRASGTMRRLEARVRPTGPRP